MAKRNQHESEITVDTSPSKRPRKSFISAGNIAQPPSTTSSPSKSVTTPVRFKYVNISVDDAQEDGGSVTPRPNGKTLFATPRKNDTTPKQSPSKLKRADQSAKRKSALALAETIEEDIWDADNALARRILETEDRDNIEDRTEQSQEPLESVTTADPSTPSKTPRGRGRPKGSRNKRSPTPEGEIPPEERYFFQNRSGPPQVSSNTLATVKLLTHEEYFDQIRNYNDHHDPDRAYLLKLHARSFPQWRFEMSQGFNICLYGYGSKRKLINNYAEWLYKQHHSDVVEPKIVMVNGFAPKLSIRNILATIGSTLVGEDEELRLTGSPPEMLDTLLTYLTENPPAAGRGVITVVVNSIDSHALRKGSVQTVLAGLAAHPLINIIASADTPTFALMWNSTLLNQFSFAFHDCTTFAPYDASEISVVDEVNELFGRKGRRIGGKEGVGFVLRSLPENARNLYRLLLNEVMAVLTDGIDGLVVDEGDYDADEGGPPTTTKSRPNGVGGGIEEIGIEYRALYQKASEQFICQNDMSFRSLLKEFYDHQMITSRRDASGTELLGVPLGKEEIEGVLDDLTMN